jgi:cellulose synthase/poly-beta-1,6-N-acetylglucosamine synthase-like glycosyltransferase
MLISIVVPAKNEEDNMPALLDSLVVQEGPIEILIADAKSTDRSPDIVRSYEQRYPNIRLVVRDGTRGESMNYAAGEAAGEALSFIGADDRAHKDWIHHVRCALEKGHDIVVGRCVMRGKSAFATLDRVELEHKGFDISYPGANTTYRKDVFLEIGGFDTRFVTAEDMDLNYRAVETGHTIYYEENAVVYRYARETLIAFLQQAFWNGYGRKQLTLKHGKLWKHYSLNNMFRKHLTVYGALRLLFGLLGYLLCKVTGGGIR